MCRADVREVAARGFEVVVDARHASGFEFYEIIVSEQSVRGAEADAALFAQSRVNLADRVNFRCTEPSAGGYQRDAAYARSSLWRASRSASSAFISGYSFAPEW